MQEGAIKIFDFSDYKPSQKKNNLFETETDKIERLEHENEQLRQDIALERSLRFSAEQTVEQLTQKLKEATEKRKRRTKKELEETDTQISEFTSSGKPKPKPAEPIRSYDDFKAIQDYFLARDEIRNWAIWTVGVSLGLRVSDLFGLKVGSVIDENGDYRERIKLIEQKTNKAQNCLITESVKDALDEYFKVDPPSSPEDYLFRSNTGSIITTRHGWKILSNAAKDLGLPMNIGSHTMRKSFANIAACVDKSTVDMNSITKIQGLLNHADQRVTMKYLGTYQDMYDKARVAVSDFVLGKSSVNVLVAGNNHSSEEIYEKLEELVSKLNTEE